MNKTLHLISVVALLVWNGCALVTEDSQSEHWGEAVKGLRLGATIDNTVFQVQDPIMLKTAFTNVSTLTISFWQSGFWPNTRIRVVDSTMKSARLTPEGDAKQKIFSPGGERTKNVLVNLKPGESRGLEPIDLRHLFEMEPATVYFVDVVYEERQAEGWRGKLTSNRVRVRIW